MGHNPKLPIASSLLIIAKESEETIPDLRENDEYSVVVVKTGQEALTEVIQRSYDVVMMDVNQPDKEALSILSSLKQANPHCPIVILNRMLEAKDKPEFLNRGAFDFLRKPYTADEFNDTLRRALECKAARRITENTISGFMANGERYRSIVQAAQDAIILGDQDGNILSWNKSAKNMFGYTAEEVVGTPLTRLMPHRYRKAHQQGMKRVRSTGETSVVGRTVELHGLRKEGDEFPIELSLSRSVHTEEVFYCGIIRDISERRVAEQSLKDSEERFRKIFINSNDAIFVLDLQKDRILHVNPRACMMLEYSHEELLSIPISAIHGKEARKFQVFCDSVKEKGKGWTNDLTCITKSGGLIVCEMSASVIDFGDSQCLVFFVCDHSAWKKAERELAEGQKRFNLTLNTINDAVFYADLSGKILWVNQQAQRLFERPLEDLIGSPLMECLSPEAADLAESRLASIRAGGSVPSLVEFKVLRPDGTYRWIEANVSNVTQDEMIIGRLLVGRDITDRRLAEEKFRLVFEKTAPCGMVMVDDRGTIVLTNQVSEQIFGYEHGEMDGQLVERLIPERFRGPHLGHRLKFSSEPHPRAIENRQEFYGLRKDGTEFPLEIALNPLTTSEGPFVLATLLDVTERKQMAEQLLEEAKLAEVSRIIGDISHDMKNMLMPILNGAKLLEEELQEHYATLTNVNSKQVKASKNFTKEALDMIVNNARRIHDRVREIADTVKGASSSLNIAPCQVSLVAEGVIDSLRFYATDKGVSLQLKGLDALPLIHADHNRLFNALYNLVNNAIPETPAGGSVAVVGSVGSEATTVVIIVADTGGGMPPEIRERLFTKEAISGKPGGTGLGTKIIKDVVDAHGGTITVESEQGKGTTFTMELPIHCQRV